MVGPLLKKCFQCLVFSVWKNNSGPFWVWKKPTHQKPSAWASKVSGASCNMLELFSQVHGKENRAKSWQTVEGSTILMVAGCLPNLSLNIKKNSIILESSISTVLPSHSCPWCPAQFQSASTWYSKQWFLCVLVRGIVTYIDPTVFLAVLMPIKGLDLLLHLMSNKFDMRRKVMEKQHISWDTSFATSSASRNELPAISASNLSPCHGLQAESILQKKTTAPCQQSYRPYLQPVVMARKSRSQSYEDANGRITEIRSLPLQCAWRLKLTT